LPRIISLLDNPLERIPELGEVHRFKGGWPVP
jgi:hypothetical protein